MIYQKTKLKNGLTLVSITGISTNAVTISSYVRAGFRFDPVSKPGLAHFTEHMLFNGTKSFPNPRAVAQAVEKYGGWHDAFTRIEHQEHSVHIPKIKFEEGAKLLLETISSPIIEVNALRKEKGIVSEEILKNKADPSKAVWDYVFTPLFFQGTSLGRPYSGTLNDIVNIKKEDVEKFISTYFVPENIVVFVAGDLEHERVVEFVEKQTSAFKQRLALPFQPIEINLKRRVLVCEEPSYFQSAILVGAKTTSIDSQDKPNIEIIQKMLAGGFSSSLVQILRDENGLIYEWESFPYFITESGYLVFSASCAHENVEKVVGIVRREFERLHKGKISKEEFENAKSFASGSLLSTIEKGEDYIDWYGLQELLCPNRVLSVEEKVKQYENISFEEIKNTASKYLGEENIFIGVIGKGNESNLKKLL